MKYAFLFVLPLFILSCARQTSPTGGPKDTIPPRLIHSLPEKGQTNFKGKEITLQFNEAVILNNPKEQIIIIPSIDKKYSITTRKNTVKINIETPLDDSTTYSFNFRDAVQDITEKNVPQNLKIAFSTGNYIDSLSISGTITDAIKNELLKDITVAIFQSDTFNMLKHKPVYITKSDKDGNYILENLKPGNYHIYAFDDKNKNLVIDSKNELYGFLTKTLNLSDNAKDITLPLTKLDVRPLKLTSIRPYNTYFNIKTAKNIISYTLTSEEAPVTSSFAEDHANIKVYNIYDQLDSLKTRFTAIDSAGNEIDTTFYVKFNQRQVKPEAFQSKSLGTRVILQTATLTSKIKFSKPLRSINFDSIFYAIDSTTSVFLEPKDTSWDSLNNILTFEKKIDKQLLTTPPPNNPQQKPSDSPKRLYQFNTKRGSFISIEQDSSTAIQEPSRPITPESSGVIIVQVNIPNNNYIIQLRDKSYNVLESKANSSKVQFENITPGDYLISVVIDSNNDGIWSPGNIIEKIEPEKIVYYKNEKHNPIINLKANWELGPLLINY